MPPEYVHLFRGAADVLSSHRGMDFGALEVAEALGRKLRVQPVTATTTRLLVDLNRSVHHRTVFSDYSRTLSSAERAEVLAKHYLPYRTKVERNLERALSGGAVVVHIAAHSFTPILEGEARNCDVGLLYDPASTLERYFADAWHEALRERLPALRIRRNYPYRGTSDALVTFLRRKHGTRRYAGLELEINQKHVGTALWPKLVTAVAGATAEAIERR